MRPLPNRFPVTAPRAVRPHSYRRILAAWLRWHPVLTERDRMTPLAVTAGCERGDTGI